MGDLNFIEFLVGIKTEKPMKSKLVLPHGSSKYGAQMGRRNVLLADLGDIYADPEAKVKLRMERLRWVSGDYDQWGAYWGGGAQRDAEGNYYRDYIYCAWNEAGVRVFVRARNRDDAKALVLEELPGATFYR